MESSLAPLQPCPWKARSPAPPDALGGGGAGGGAPWQQPASRWSGRCTQQLWPVQKWRVRQAVKNLVAEGGGAKGISGAKTTAGPCGGQKAAHGSPRPWRGRHAGAAARPPHRRCAAAGRSGPGAKGAARRAPRGAACAPRMEGCSRKCRRMKRRGRAATVARWCAGPKTQGEGGRSPRASALHDANRARPGTPSVRPDGGGRRGRGPPRSGGCEHAARLPPARTVWALARLAVPAIRKKSRRLGALGDSFAAQARVEGAQRPRPAARTRAGQRSHGRLAGRRRRRRRRRARAGRRAQGGVFVLHAKGT
jgi:hypothetical protein